MKTYNFQVKLEPEEDGRWSAWLASYPACGAWGDTKDEALEALRDMTVLFLEVMEEAGEVVCPDTVVEANDTFGETIDGTPKSPYIASIRGEAISILTHT